VLGDPSTISTSTLRTMSAWLSPTARGHRWDACRSCARVSVVTPAEGDPGRHAVFAHPHPRAAAGRAGSPSFSAVVSTGHSLPRPPNGREGLAPSGVSPIGGADPTSARPPPSTRPIRGAHCHVRSDRRLRARRSGARRPPGIDCYRSPGRRSLRDTESGGQGCCWRAIRELSPQSVLMWVFVKRRPARDPRPRDGHSIVLCRGTANARIRWTAHSVRAAVAEGSIIPNGARSSQPRTSQSGR
jgi:hypothetical protein